jgi:hypothetical protein
VSQKFFLKKSHAVFEIFLLHMPIKFLISHLLCAFTIRFPGTFWRNQQLLLLALHEEEDDNNKPDRFKMLLDEEGHRRCIAVCHK